MGTTQPPAGNARRGRIRAGLPVRVLLAAGTLVAGTVVATAAPAAAHTPTVTTWCPYRVTTDSGDLNVRSHHSTSFPILGTLARGSTVFAGADGTATGSGYTWRQVSSGWAAATFLRRAPGSCLF
ncbi:hypothetical protein [Micromonospora sp. CPCC 206061]|uniref:hypothetical protein n=1 Tax=Micromonospora sp. CPCC 206061 TaxID=3122410 RepID=UPI002FF0CA89